MPRRAAIFDRDGTLIKDVGYLSDPAGIELIEGVRDTLKTLKTRGYFIGMASNQSGIGRGFFNESDCIRVNQSLEARLGLTFDALEVCVHRPEDNCRCRKPKPYMIERILKDFGCNPADAFYAGDKKSDMEAGHAAGVRTILCRFGPENREPAGVVADITVSRFAEILEYL